MMYHQHIRTNFEFRCILPPYAPSMFFPKFKSINATCANMCQLFSFYSQQAGLKINSIPISMLVPSCRTHNGSCKGWLGWQTQAHQMMQSQRLELPHTLPKLWYERRTDLWQIPTWQHMPWTASLFCTIQESAQEPETAPRDWDQSICKKLAKSGHICWGRSLGQQEEPPNFYDDPLT